MATVVVIDMGRPEPFTRILSAMKDTSRVMRRIGAIMEAGAQQAFDDQKFGQKWPWLPRYPSQKEPFINVAGALSDFSKGSKTPKKRRFDRRPAARDTGELMRSIRSRVVTSSLVEVGTTRPYAAIHQWGLVSSMPITPEARKKAKAWVATEEGKPYRDKLSPILKKGVPTLDTKVVQRPFLGVTDQMEEDIRESTESLIAEAARGSNGGA